MAHRELPTHYISRLRLTNFRNYASAALDPDARHVVLTGPNGAGKTNLLEAISLLGPGRGLRRAAFEQLALHSSETGWAVAASLETPMGPVDMGTGLDQGVQTGRKVRINGSAAKSVEELGEYARILWLTPALDGLFTGPVGDRRRFFDRLVMTLIPSHGAEANAFEKAMRQRNKLLESDFDPGWMSAIEAQMATHAAAMHFARVDMITHLNQLLDETRGDAPFPAAHVALAAQDELQQEFVSSSALESFLTDLWRDRRGIDRVAGRTTLGPHRTDMQVTHLDKQMPAGLCSTGEQKALLIGLILAQAELVRQITHISPLLLLDEIAAHLDPSRRAALFEILNALGTQCWMTGTDKMLFEALGDEAQFVAVNDAQLAL
ncbi:DNA replication/repair protein RecF [Maritalea mediterranea]|uniref:DNA replication and repair protein RecF n=1 Tax=Maritalea mediterranea TaxID=2909667 RepID=A0ABS9E2M3_9HYPH|nr:DNA replication/repair protein RecF [Maritalea mediterranea]MCF4097033.1 DNA replication/repair protein RecF [Maritalea mediterranea]